MRATIALLILSTAISIWYYVSVNPTFVFPDEKITELKQVRVKSLNIITHYNGTKERIITYEYRGANNRLTGGQVVADSVYYNSLKIDTVLTLIIEK